MKSSKQTAKSPKERMMNKNIKPMKKERGPLTVISRNQGDSKSQEVINCLRLDTMLLLLS